MTEFIRHLIALDEARNGKPKADIEFKRLHQWIFSECQLRWPDVTKRDVWSAIQEASDNE